MKESQKLELRGSAVRQRLNTLSGRETLTAEETAEVDQLTTEYGTLETRRRAALVAEDVEGVTSEHADDGEGREVRDLVGRVALRNYLGAAAEGSPVQDAEAELNAALDLPATNYIPFQALETRDADNEDLETRADAETTAPSTTGARQDSIMARVFANTAANFLGVRMPTVPVGQSNFPVFTSGATGATADGGAVKDAETATFTVTALTPKRLTARYLFRVEDMAVFAGMEEALRADLRGALGEALDAAVLVGDGVSPNVSGFLGAGLASPADPTVTAAFAQYVDEIAGMVDGRYAQDVSGVRMLVGPSTYANIASAFATSSGVSAINYVRDLGGMIKVSAHVPTKTAAHIQGSIGARGVGNTPAAVAPMWQGIRLIRDEGDRRRERSGSLDRNHAVQLRHSQGGSVRPQKVQAGLG